MLSLLGNGIGNGIAIGRAYVLKSVKPDAQEYKLSGKQVTPEIERFKNALLETKKQFEEIRDNIPKDAPIESAAFVDAHILMLEDPLIVDETIKLIQQKLINAESAIKQQESNLIAVFENMQDPYLRNKADDISHIVNRILRNLLKIEDHNLDEFNKEDLSDKIVVSDDLAPSETIFLKSKKVPAFITDHGSPISHTSIIARSLSIPAVVGMHSASRYIKDGDLLIVDGKRGIVIVKPAKFILQEFKQLRSRIRGAIKALEKLTGKASKTEDGERIALLANIELPQEVSAVKKANAQGIGLYRTEYLFMNRSKLPTESEQYQAYKKIITRLGKPITFRTLDVAADKQLAADFPKKESTKSPLGLRGIRLSLNNIELFKIQLRAILRASAHGPAALMVPMLSNIDESLQVLSLIEETKQELSDKNIDYDKNIKIGGMIEVPAAAISADLFAEKLDFLSIGTNDLIQYTLAIDRIDDAVSYLYDPLHPSVLRLIKSIIQAGQKADIPISMCGEMAGNVKYTRLLLGLGLRIFSMDASRLLSVKEQILNTDTKKLKYQANKILRCHNFAESQVLLSKLNQTSS